MTVKEFKKLTEYKNHATPKNPVKKSSIKIAKEILSR